MPKMGRSRVFRPTSGSVSESAGATPVYDTIFGVVRQQKPAIAAGTTHSWVDFYADMPKMGRSRVFRPTSGPVSDSAGATPVYDAIFGVVWRQKPTIAAGTTHWWVDFCADK